MSKWQKWQAAKVGTQPAVVRFRVKVQAKTVGKVVEFQDYYTGVVTTGRVTKVNPDGYSFLEL